VWQPIAYAGSYGTNGFHLPFSDNSTAAALGTDTSGNGNDWIDGNTSNPMVLVGNTGTTSTCTFTPYLAVTSGSLYTTGGSASNKTIVTDVGNISVSSTGWTSLGSATKIYSFSAVMQPGDGGWYVSAIESNSSILTSPGSFTVTVGNDSLVDSPTNYGTDTGAGSEVRGNYATLNPLDNGGGLTLTNGNLDASNSASAHNGARATIQLPSSGKWYFEGTIETLSGGANAVGVSTTASSNPGLTASGTYFIDVDTTSIYKFKDGSNLATLTGIGSPAVGSVLQIAYDADAQKLWIGHNNNWASSGNPAAGTNEAFSSVSGVFPTVAEYGSSKININFGQRPFAYTAPSGFKALCTTNLEPPTIADGSTAMDVALYTGNGSTQTISGLNFSPDLVWIKKRSDDRDHCLCDVVRGTSKRLRSNTTDAETTESVVTAFNSNGFDIGSDAGVNASSGTYVAWTWDAGSSTVTNPDGSIPSQVRANASAGFSVVTYTGTGSNATVGHGLGVAPQMMIVKRRSTTDDWAVYHSAIGATKFLYLNLTSAQDTASTRWQDTAPSSTVFSIGTSGQVNGSGSTYVAYCFAPVSGYSSFGSYTGNGSADGPFVYTGFRPRWIMWKNSGSGNDWRIVDTTRGNYNLVNSAYLYPNIDGVENTNANDAMDILSNGFKFRTSAEPSNASGFTYVYAAFAEHPFATARAR
jgi:hypothetical protein